MPPLPNTHREAIREIFLRRRSEYTTKEAASLLRLGLGDVLNLIENGTLHADVKRKRRQLGGPRHSLISWNELASAAMLRWTVLQIHDALGEAANRTLPRLFRPAELKKVRLPEYQVRLLETLAQNKGVSLDEYIYDALLSLEVAADPDVMEKLLPGFNEAMRFPDV
jgi:hypothetical protein